MKKEMKNELLSLTYGCIVKQIMEDCEEESVNANKNLEQIGFNIGSRLIDEYLAKTEIPVCKSFKEVGGNVIEAFKLFFGVESKLVMKNDQEFSITFNQNPLAENVAIPKKYEGLSYSNIYCGIIRGALEAVNMRVKCYFTRDKLVDLGEKATTLKHDYEIKVELEELIKKKLKDYED